MQQKLSATHLFLIDRCVYLVRSVNWYSLKLWVRLLHNPETQRKKFTRCTGVQAKTGGWGLKRNKTMALSGKGKSTLIIYISHIHLTSTKTIIILNEHPVFVWPKFEGANRALGPATRHSKLKANKKHVPFETNHHTPSDLSILQYGVWWDSNQKCPSHHPSHLGISNDKCHSSLEKRTWTAGRWRNTHGLGDLFVDLCGSCSSPTHGFGEISTKNFLKSR